jgi:hypothetical protein
LFSGCCSAAAEESLGLDRNLKSHTACMLYGMIPSMLESRLRPLIERFREIVTQK